MPDINTLAVTHPSRGESGDSDVPALTSWTTQEEPSEKVSWAPHLHSRPRRPRKASCREVVSANRSLSKPTPSIQVHGSRCRCAEAEAQDRLKDAALAEKIVAASAAVLAQRAANKQAQQAAAVTPSRFRQHSHSHTKLASLSSSGHALLSALTRRLLAPPAPAASIPELADLCIGCANLDIARVARYLVHRAPAPLPVNQANHLGTTPLMAAVRSPAARARPRAHLAMVAFLLDCGADPNAARAAGAGRGRATETGESVLSVACALGLPDVVRLLVGRGAVVDAPLPHGTPAAKGVSLSGWAGLAGPGQTALHVAVLADRPECVGVLAREGGADVDAVFDAAPSAGWSSGQEETGLTSSSLNGTPRSRRGRSGRADGGAMRRHSVSALHLAHGSYACTEVLVQAGADVSARDGFGRTPLHWAAEAGSVAVVGLLVGAGAELDAVDVSGTTPLAATVAALEDGKGSARQGHVEVVHMLVKAGADVGVACPGKGSLRERLSGLQEWRGVPDDMLEVEA